MLIPLVLDIHRGKYLMWTRSFDESFIMIL